jgi:hypothetical protein
MVQLYKSDLVDLLRPSNVLPVALDVIYNAKTRLIEVEGVFTINTSSKDFLNGTGEQELISAVNARLDNRLMRSTYVNENSSRSHLLCSLILTYRTE